MLYTNVKAIELTNEGESLPAFLDDHEGIKSFHISWHNSDGWRGYYESKAVYNSGWKKIDYDGWVTGNWEDAPEGHSGSEVEDKLEALAKEYEAKGYDIEAVFVPSSNVFSTCFDVFKHKVNNYKEIL